MEEKTFLSNKMVCFQTLDFGTSKPNSNILVENYFSLETFITSEGDVSYNVLYYQKLSIDRIQFLC